MTEMELRTAFEALTLPAGQLSHREHVRLAWSYLCELPLLDVLRVFPENLRRYAESIGAATIYHETVTWAFLMLIDERIEHDERETWDSFIGRNPDLLSKDLLERYYNADTLASDRARRRFLFPLPSAGGAQPPR